MAGHNLCFNVRFPLQLVRVRLPFQALVWASLDAKMVFMACSWQSFPPMGFFLMLPCFFCPKPSQAGGKINKGASVRWSSTAKMSVLVQEPRVVLYQSANSQTSPKTTNPSENELTSGRWLRSSLVDCPPAVFFFFFLASFSLPSGFFPLLFAFHASLATARICMGAEMDFLHHGISLPPPFLRIY